MCGGLEEKRVLANGRQDMFVRKDIEQLLFVWFVIEQCTEGMTLMATTRPTCSGDDFYATIDATTGRVVVVGTHGWSMPSGVASVDA